jgi:PAS domain S-box-containing protein
LLIVAAADDSSYRRPIQYSVGSKAEIRVRFSLSKLNAMTGMQSQKVPDAVSDAVLAGIVTISADAIVCVDESQHIIFFNEGAERIFGYSSVEILGQPLETLIPDRFRGAHAEQVQRFGQTSVRARKMGERGQISGLRKNGEEFPADAAISHLDGREGKVYAVVLRDVTERRRAHESQRFLAESGETLASSLGADETLRNVTRITVPFLGDACIVNLYHEGRLQRVALAHVDTARAAALEVARTDNPIDLEGNHPVAEAIRTGHIVRVSADSPQAPLDDLIDIFGKLPRDGVILPLVARGQRLGVMALYRESLLYSDNEVFLAEEIARRAALAIDNARLYDLVHVGIRARDDMIGIVAHDLRNPVNAVKMLTGVMLDHQREEPLSSEIVEYATVIRQAAEQMDSLIRDLLDVTRVEAGRLRVDAIVENTEELLSDALRTLAPVANQKSVRLRLSAHDDLPPVLADRERIAQAISNLVGNAVKFSEAGSEIHVGVSVEPREVVFSVRDTGHGMTPEQLSHAFDRFWQSSRTDRQGAGLGLAITKGIVEAHGGRIWAESRAGEGSTFFFTLPSASS